MKFYFVRHGETDWNVQLRIQGSTDTNLNQNGLDQAEALGKQLEEQGLKVERIYSSRLKRAHETAERIGKHLNLTPIVEDGLEEMNFGKWEGHSWTEVEELYQSEFDCFVKNRRFTNTPNGESYQEVLERLLQTLFKISHEVTGDVMVVTHSAVLYSLLSYINNTPFEQMRDLYHFGNAQVTVVDEHQLIL